MKKLILFFLLAVSALISCNKFEKLTGQYTLSFYEADGKHQFYNASDSSAIFTFTSDGNFSITGFNRLPAKGYYILKDDTLSLIHESDLYVFNVLKNSQDRLDLMMHSQADLTSALFSFKKLNTNE